MTEITETTEIIRNHADYLPLITGLNERHFKPIGDFEHKDFVFESFINQNRIIWIQKDKQGRVLLIYKQVNLTRVIDILNDIDKDIVKPILKPRTNFITKVIAWLEKAELIIYGK